jgi:preprotein translocase subunit SecA
MIIYFLAQPDILSHNNININISDNNVTQPVKKSITNTPPTKQKKQLSPQSKDTKKIGRNTPCPCGSKKKYKKCCGNLK